MRSDLPIYIHVHDVCFREPFPEHTGSFGFHISLAKRWCKDTIEVYQEDMFVLTALSPAPCLDKLLRFAMPHGI